MTAPLYLDTARLGLMSPRAREALYSLTRLVSAEGLSARFCELLTAGAEALPERARRAYRGLACWGGLGELKRSLRALLGLPPETPCLLANRSAQLMRLAARLLFRRSGRVLVTDLEWPGYLDVLGRERERAGGELFRAAVREGVLAGEVPEGELAAALVSRYRELGCDGLLSAVSNLGVRLPVEAVCRAIRREGLPLRFAVIDGAQAFCHVLQGPGLGHCDLYLAGCHKWLGGYHPMGLAFFPRAGEECPAGRGAVEAEQGEADDPLLRLTRGLEGAPTGQLTETVDISCLFSARGAVADLEAEGRSGPRLETLLGNAQALAEAAQGTGWRPLLPAPGLRSGVLLLRADGAGQAPAEAVRSAFDRRGVVLTAYEGGVIRLSVPARPWRRGEVGRMRQALAAAA